MIEMQVMKRIPHRAMMIEMFRAWVSDLNARRAQSQLFCSRREKRVSMKHLMMAK